jgi:ABC-type phosphate transport system substrate-binding protein
MRKFHCKTLLAVALLAAAGAAGAADYVVIVNKANEDAVSPEFVQKVYRGETRSWPGGGSIATAALPESSPVRTAFDKAVLDKSPAQSKSLWATLTFSGKMVPPKILDDEAAMVKFVSEEKKAIGYVSAGAAGSSVKVVK